MPMAIAPFLALSSAALAAASGLAIKNPRPEVRPPRPVLYPFYPVLILPIL